MPQSSAETVQQSERTNGRATGDSEANRRRPFRRPLLLFLLLAALFVAGLTALTTRGPSPNRPSRTNSPQALSFLGAKGTTARNELLGVGDFVATADPDDDDWESERIGAETQAILKTIGSLISQAGEIETDDIAELQCSEYDGPLLRPDQLVTAFEDDCLRVDRGTPEFESPRVPLVAAVDTLRQSFDEDHAERVKFKSFRVETNGDDITTVAYYQCFGRRDGAGVQQSAIWRCRWTRGESAKLKLRSLQVVDFEEVVNKRQREKWFVECTPSIIGHNPSYSNQLLYGVEHWRSRIDYTLGTAFRGLNGLSIADVNGDGWEDVYICQTGGVPNRLFLRQEDGTAVDESETAGLDYLENTTAALFLDLDNDADQDVVLALDWGLIVLSNDGDGVFTLEERIPLGKPAYSLAAADYDNDGDLDIYVCAYERNAYMMGIALPIPFHDARNGGRNLLLNNRGNWRFENKAIEAGLDVENSRFSLAASWEDFDRDGDLDLYVANDFGRNNLYRNDDGFFVDIAAEAGVEDFAAGMSASWGDFNNDGWMDLYVSNMFSSAGSRISYQRRFRPDADDTSLARTRRHARGNTLFENAGDGTFRDVSVSTATTMGRWAWGSLFIDLNNDGREDLYVTNGFATGEDDGDL